MNFKNMDRLLEDYVNDGIPGCSVIVYKDHEEIYRGKAGYADLENKTPISYDNLYNIYSASKVITCTAMLMLIGMGKADVDDPLSKYIPEFRNMNVLNYHSNGTLLGTRPAAREITLRDLFTMSAGLDYDLNSAPIKKIREETNGRCPTLQTIKALAEKPLCFDPGEHFKYSLCHDVLGAVIEVISGMSLGEFMKKNIFDVLGMENTGFVVPEEKKHLMACQYIYNTAEKRAVDRGIANEFKLGTEYESGGAGLISCLEDYGKFVDALACGGIGKNGGRILSPEMVELMRQNQLTDQRALDFEHRPGYGYGLGVQVHIDKARSLLPSPIGDFGWDGAAGAQMIIDPVNHLSMFYVQHLRGTHIPLRRRLVNVVYS